MNAILKYLPLVSALLLFVGYINYTSYYRHFDIEIASYLTTGELILSFLPLTKGILFLSLFLVIAAVLEIALLNIQKEIKADDSEDTNSSLISLFVFKSSYRLLVDDLRYGRWKIPWGMVRIVFNLIGCITGVLSICLFVGYFFVMIVLPIESKPFPALDYRLVMTLSFIWFVLLFELISRADKLKRLKNASLFYIAFFVISFLYFVTVSNKYEATRILEGDPEKQVYFVLDSVLVKTDSNFVYVGKTSEYLFVRDRTLKLNKVFKVSDISTLEIKSVR